MLRTLFCLTLLLGKDISACVHRDFCQFNEEQIFPSCYCDENCLVYEDCCKEFILSHLQVNQTAPHEPDHYDDQHNQSCIILSERTDQHPNRIGAFMIDTCLESGDKCPIQRDSSNLEGSLPVTFKDRIYVNADCAKCNNINAFEVWSIVYELARRANIVSSSQSGKSISDENTILMIQQGNVTVNGYYLQPPGHLNPRYCFLESLASINKRFIKGNSTFMQHQNNVICNGAFFKNLDICQLHGCCRKFDPYCYDLYLPSFGKDDIKGSTAGGLKVLLQFDAHGNENPKKAKTEVSKVTYMSQLVGIVFRIDHTTTELSDLHECLQGLFVYLSNTEFRLFPDFLRFHYGSVGNNSQVAFTTFRENAPLSDDDLTRLLRLKIYFFIELRPEGKRAVGEIRVTDVNGSWLTSINLQGALKKSSLSRIDLRKTDSKTFNACKNVSLTFIRGNAGDSDLDVDCMPEYVVNNSERKEVFSIILVGLIIAMFRCVRQIWYMCNCI